MRRRLQRFLYSRGNLVGSLLAAGGLALHLVGLLGGVPWLPVVVALYAIGVLLARPRRDAPTKVDAADEAAEDTAADAAEVKAGLDRLLITLHGKVADDLYEKFASIRRSILATLADGSAGDASDPNVYLIRATAVSYLPEAFATYLRLPRSLAEARAVAAGRTAHDLLLEQLDLMDKRLRDVAENIVRHDSDRLLANGRFLAQRFAVSSLQVDDAAAPVQVQAAPVDAGELVGEAPEAQSERQRAEAAVERERVR